MELQELNIERSATIGKLMSAISSVSNSAITMGKNADNPFFKSKYVTLEKVQNVLKPLLKEHGLSVSQPLYGKGIMTIVAENESGEYMIIPSNINTGDAKPQDQMSGVSYMKRYALVGLFNLITGDRDDDGNTINGNKKNNKTNVELKKKISQAIQKVTNRDELTKLFKLYPTLHEDQEVIDMFTEKSDEFPQK